MAEGGIGARLKRKEDARLLRGRGRFVGDIHMTGLDPREREWGDASRAG